LTVSTFLGKIQPFAEKECKAMLVEPAGTINTGGSGGEMTAENGVWI